MRSTNYIQIHTVQVTMRAASQMVYIKSIYCGKCCILEKKKQSALLSTIDICKYHEEAGFHHLHNNCEQISYDTHSSYIMTTWLIYCTHKAWIESQTY